MELKYLVDAGAAVVGLYLMWQILKVVLDYRKNRSQPIANNGAAMEMIKVFREQTAVVKEQTVLLERIVQVGEDHKGISLANSSKLDRIDKNQGIHMDRQQTIIKTLDEIKTGKTR